MRSKSLITLAAAVLAAMAVAGTAQAAPFHNGDYPRYAYEGRYPDNTPCTYSLNQSRVATWGGRRITLRYYYSGGCGSFARIDNAPRDCSVWLDRTPDRDTVGGWDYVGETVDPGINFAYTKVGNNLNGRLSRGALVCGPRNYVIARTGWY